MEVLLWCGGEKASLLTRRCESTGGGTRSCDGGENDAGAVERVWFRWCAMAAEAAAIVVREEEELAGGSRWLQVYAARRDGRKRWRVVVREPAAVMASLRRRWCYFADGLSARTSFTELWRSAVMREMARCCCGGAVAAGASPAMV